MTDASVQLPLVRFWLKLMFVTWMHFYFARYFTLSECISLLWCGRWFHWGVPDTSTGAWASGRAGVSTRVRAMTYVFQHHKFVLFVITTTVFDLSCDRAMAIVSYVVQYVIQLLLCYVFLFLSFQVNIYMCVCLPLFFLLFYIKYTIILWRATKSEITRDAAPTLG